MNQTEKKELVSLLPVNLQTSVIFTDNQKIILGFLYKKSEIANNEGWFFISNKAICEETNLSEPTLTAAIKQYKKYSFIERVKGHTGKASEYKINIESINNYNDAEEDIKKIKDYTKMTKVTKTNTKVTKVTKIDTKVTKTLEDIQLRMSILEEQNKELITKIDNLNLVIKKLSDFRPYTYTDTYTDTYTNINNILNNKEYIKDNNINKNNNKEKENINTNIEEKESNDKPVVTIKKEKEVELVPIKTKSLENSTKKYIQFNNIFYDTELNKINKLTSTYSVLATYRQLKDYINSTNKEKNIKIKLIEGLETIVNARCAVLKGSEMTSKTLSNENDTSIPNKKESTVDSLKIAKEEALKEKRLNYFEKLNKDCQIFKEAKSIEILQNMTINLINSIEFIDEVNKEEIKNFIFKRFNQVKESLEESNTDVLRASNVSDNTSIPNKEESVSNELKIASNGVRETYDKDKNSKIKNMYADFNKRMKENRKTARKKWLLESEVKGTLDSLMFNLQTKTDVGNMDKFKYCKEHSDIINQLGLNKMFEDVKELITKPAIA